MSDKQVAWIDRQNMSNLWISILQKATYAMMDNDFRTYKRGIDILICSLFKQERDKVIEYIKDKGTDIGSYTAAQQFIVDVLEEKGYLMHQGRSSVPESFESKPQQEWESERK